MSTSTSRATALSTSTAAGAMALSLLLAAPAQAIVPNNNTDAESIVDTEGGVNGIGQMTVWNGDGTVGLCTGSLINPRTVLFAAHCVNSRPQEAYGSNTGGVPISFGFEVDNLPAIIDWINNGFASNPDVNIFNANEIQYSPESLTDIFGLGFLEADIALATLDTPATGIPTWALLFSALPAPDSIDDATGTGYHVTITGYGATGNATEGSVDGIDFRRRAAENFLGALTSLDDIDSFLFGPVDPTLPQNLYFTDFDDPARGTPDANEFDFNVLKDDALPNEGTTAGGDSGGPLILDETFDEEVVIGVLSGGSRYFADQPFSSYGTSSFYQPLFLFWDYIAEVNPYRYVGARRGSGRWENPNHWVSLQDPAYRIIDEEGNLVTGTPSEPGLGTEGTEPDFGQVCNQLPPDDICLDLNDGTVIVDGTPTAGGTTSISGIGRADLAIPGGVQAAFAEAPQTRTSQASATPSASTLPDPTIENGLPGATGFVPDNIEPDPANGVRARYFDVTLDNFGTTYLSTAVEIDRLTVAGFASLVIRRDGALTVVADYNQIGGRTRVDGLLLTGEALVIGGILSGSGTIDPTYLTAISSLVTPAGFRTGTLTVQGDLILGSSTVTAFNLTRTANDRIAVTGDADNSGVAALGGIAFFSRGLGPRPRWNQSFEILTAEGGVDGTFDQALGGIGILRPVLSYGDNNVVVTLEAGRLAANLSSGSAFASAFAGGLDRLRGGSYDSLSGFYGAIDVMDAASLTATLDGLSPHIVSETMAVGTGQNELMLGLVSDRLSLLGTRKHQPGTFSIVGAPETIGIAAGNASISRSAANGASFTGRVVPAGRTLGALPDNVSGFISGGFENSRTATRFGSRSDAQANWHIAMGLEVELTDNLTVGGASAFINGRSTLQGSEAQLRTNQAMAYASYRLGGGAYVAGLGSASVTDIETARFVTGGFESARFSNDTRASSYTAGIETGVNIGIAQGFELTPRAAVRYTRAEVEGYSEAGSEIALAIDDIREQRLEGRVGFNVQGQADIGHSGWSVRPRLSADYVRALGQDDSAMTVRFAQARDIPIILPGIGSDTAWAEVRGGISLERGNLSLTTAFETDIGRDLQRDDRAVAELSFRF